MQPSFDAVPKRQILSYRVRGPELAAIFDLLCRSGPTTFEALSDLFAGTEAPGTPRNNELLLDALDFLRAVELVGRWRDENGRQQYQVIEGLPNQMPFRLLLLSQLHRMSDNRNAFRIVHDLAVRKNLFFASKADLVKQLEPLYPEDYAWNTEKLRSWEWLSTFIGLVRPLNPRLGELMICPRPDLVLNLLHAFAADKVRDEQDGVQATVLIGAWLQFIEDRFFSCTTERREIYDGLSHALRAIEATGQIKLEMKSDAPGAVTIRGRNVSHICFELAK